MRRLIAAFSVASLFVASLAATAQAAPTQVNVRIEGKSETLLEGPLAVSPHAVSAASDGGKMRRCNGINFNDPWNVTPAPVPTSVAADAMALLGETFDGQWYAQYEDYFLTRWGPDAQDPGSGAYWGILVNDVFTSVGGCQYQLDSGDEVLWVYDAFKHRPTLALFPAAASYSSGPRPLTATASLGIPFPVEVVSYGADEESAPPSTPARAGSAAYPGAKVAPVQTGAKGFEKVDTTSAATVTTDSAGKASVVFSEPGWHRIKATLVGAGGVESVVRSNRLDVCVPPGGAVLEGASSCSELPAADQVRVPPVTEAESPPHEEPPSARPGAGQGGGGSPSPPAGPDVSPIQVTVPRLDRKNVAQGRVGVSWRVLSPGPGIAGWTIYSQALGRKGGRYVSRASGAAGTSASLRLPAGVAYRLRFTIVDVLGRGSSVALGKVDVPDARRP